MLLAAVLASSFFIARSIKQGADQKYVDGAIPLQGAVQDMVLQMVNQQSGSRGYVITANRAELQPVTAGRASVPNDLRAIAKRVVLAPALAVQLARIRVHITGLERFYDGQISLVASGPAGQRAAAKRVPQGEALFDAFRLDAGQMLAEANRFVAAAQRSQNRRYMLLLVLLLSLGALTLTIAVALTVSTPRRSYRILLELERERQSAEARFLGEQEAQREVAVLVGRLQGSLLPVLDIPDPRVQLTTIYRPGERRLRLGGDFYDCMQLEDGRIALLIGDVSGHGPDAAALGASLRAAWRGLTLSETGHGDVLRYLQAVFEREGAGEDAFATIAYGLIDPTRTRLELVLAGHPPPILLDGGKARAIDAVPGPPLGVFGEADWPISTVLLDTPSAVVIFYTDGLTEARTGPGSRERVGIEGLVAEIAATCAPPITTHDLAALTARLSARGGEPFADDAAILALTIYREAG